MLKRRNKLAILLLLTSFLFLLVGCKKDVSDAEKFKEEYESLNGQKNGDIEYRNISIDKNNPVIYKSEDEIVNLIKNKDTFVVYFGFASCPWCRSVLPTMLETFKEYGIPNIYYVDISNIRDTYEIKNGKLEKTKEGTEGYYKLLDLLKEKLSDYTVNDESGKTTDTGEKRIYAPNVIGVIKGEVKVLDTGISSLQKDPYMELNDEIKKDMKGKFKTIFAPVDEDLNSCNISGC